MFLAEQDSVSLLVRSEIKRGVDQKDTGLKGDGRSGTDERYGTSLRNIEVSRVRNWARDLKRAGTRIVRARRLHALLSAPHRRPVRHRMLCGMCQ